MENLEHTLDNISGDVLLAAGFVAYLGPFTVRNLLTLPGAASPPQTGPTLRPHSTRGSLEGHSFCTYSFNEHSSGAPSEPGAVPGTGDKAVHETARTPPWQVWFSSGR